MNRPEKHRTAFEVSSEGAVALLRLPRLTVVGREHGPVTAIVAGQHGREVVGMAAAAAMFETLDPHSVLGRVEIFPALNPLALKILQQDFPTEASRYRKLGVSLEGNLDRLWGATESLDPILAATTRQLWDGVLSHCDFLLDLHCWSDWFCPMAWAHRRDEAILRATGFPFITRRTDGGGASLGTLRERAWSTQKPVVVIELTGQNVIRAESLALGKRTLRNFLIATGNLDEEADLSGAQVELDEGAAEQVIHLGASGLWIPERRCGDSVKPGDLLGQIISLDTFEPLWEARAEISGLLFFNGPPIWGEDHREHQVAFSGQKIAVIRTPHPLRNS